jgi:hypothetical protein
VVLTGAAPVAAVVASPTGLVPVDDASEGAVVGWTVAAVVSAAVGVALPVRAVVACDTCWLVGVGAAAVASGAAPLVGVGGAGVVSGAAGVEGAVVVSGAA